jgi:FkbM family methyltransferase
MHRAAVSNNLHNFNLGHEIQTTAQVPSGSLCFDIGANRGEATRVALESGYSRVLAVEPGPTILESLRANFAGDSRVEILDLAVSDTNGQTVTFYEAEEDGLSTLNIDWLTGHTARYKDRPYREVVAETTTMDTLISKYGLPDLVNIDVEGAEDWVLRGMTCNPGPKHVALEWHVEDLPKVFEMLCRLRDVNGYREYALQYITHHLHAPAEYRPLDGLTYESLLGWHDEMRAPWESGGWIDAGRLRATADAGMFWVR